MIGTPRRTDMDALVEDVDAPVVAGCAKTEILQILSPVGHSLTVRCTTYSC